MDTDYHNKVLSLSFTFSLPSVYKIFLPWKIFKFQKCKIFHFKSVVAVKYFYSKQWNIIYCCRLAVSPVYFLDIKLLKPVLIFLVVYCLFCYRTYNLYSFHCLRHHHRITVLYPKCLFCSKIYQFYITCV